MGSMGRLAAVGPGSKEKVYFQIEKSMKTLWLGRRMGLLIKWIMILVKNKRKLKWDYIEEKSQNWNAKMQELNQRAVVVKAD